MSEQNVSIATRSSCPCGRLDLAEQHEREADNIFTWNPVVLAKMDPVTMPPNIKDISRVNGDVASDISGAEGSHWRRKREYGWPCQFMSDGALKVYFDKGYSYERFVNEDEVDIYGTTAVPDVVVLKLSTEINQLLNTYGNLLMVLDPCPIEDNGEVSISNTTHDARHYQDSPANPFGAHTLIRRITRRLDDLLVVESTCDASK